MQCDRRQVHSRLFCDLQRNEEFMSYLVLARKWRPADFSEMIGQDHITKTLTNALSLGKLAHAYVFHGPRGVGKTSAARILAKSINCERGMGPTPCNECSSCVSINQGSSLDVVEMDGASNRGIDEIRELKEHVGYAPVSSRYKVYIIDEVHMLTEQAFNALLKTLEEPPPHVVFVFATTEVHKIPATILSRCQRFEFRRIPVSLIVNRLSMLAEREGISVEENALILIARRADGCLRDAESLLDQAVAAAQDTIDEEMIRNLLGLIPLETLSVLLEKISAGDIGDVARQLDGMVSQGKEIDRIIADLIELILRLIRGRAGVKDQTDTSDERDLLTRTTESLGTADLLRYMQALQHAQGLARQSPRPGPVLESALFKCALMDRSKTIQELLSLIGNQDTGKHPTAIAPSVPKAKIKRDRISESDPSTAPRTDRSLVGLFTDIRGSLGSLVNKGQIQWKDKRTIRIEFDAADDFAFQGINRPGPKQQLLEVVRHKFGEDVRMEIIRRDPHHDSKPTESSQTRKNHPLIGAIIERFDGVVIKSERSEEEGRNT